MASTAIGFMRERLVLQRNDPPVLAVVSLTRVNTTATATTAVPHGYVATDYVTLAGAAPVGYDGKWKIVSVPSPTTFTITVLGTLTTPATGVITVVYTSNAQGGQGLNFWRTLDTIAAELIPLSAMERLQIQAVQSEVRYRFRVRTRADLVETLRLLWTPSAPPGAARQTLEITGVLPCEDGREYSFLEASKVPA